MTMVIKKAKAPAKPRATTSTPRKATPKNDAVAQKVKTAPPSHAEIEQLARQFWQERGGHDGQAEEDWLRAERELGKTAS